MTEINVTGNEHLAKVVTQRSLARKKKKKQNILKHSAKLTRKTPVQEFFSGL